MQDVSRLSTEQVAPFPGRTITDTTFVSSVDIGSVNLLRVPFHLDIYFIPVNLRACLCRVSSGLIDRGIRIGEKDDRGHSRILLTVFERPGRAVSAILNP